MRKINLSIIGGGLASVTLLDHFIQEFIHIKYSNEVSITLFEKKEDVGVGLAYQHDLDSLLLNTPIEKMFLNANDLENFQSWFTQYISLQNVKDQNTDYISRKAFGDYLKSRLNKNIDLAQSLGIHITVVRKAVVNIVNSALFREIETIDSEKYTTDFIVLCTGNNQAADVYALSNTEHYINSPYPVHTNFRDIKKTDSVGIIGNGLTGIDVSISLKNLGVTGKIGLLSRRHVYPYVRSKTNIHELKFLTTQAMRCIKKEKGGFTLKDTLRLFKKELNSMSDLSWKFFCAEQNKEANFADILSEEIKAAEKIRPWQGLLVATNSVIEEWWDIMDHYSKMIFLKHFHRMWMNKRVPIPINNAKILMVMAKENQLEVLSGLTSIHYDAKKEQYAVCTQTHQKYYDWIINATGPSRYVQPADTLLHQLLENRLARKNPYGGLDVDFETSALIDGHGFVNPFIRLLGHNTSGTFYYVSSFEMLAQKAVKIAKNLVSSMQSYDIKMSLSA